MTLRLALSVGACLMALGTTDARAQGLAVSPYGTGCGPVAAGAAGILGNHLELSFSLTQAAPHALGIAVIGVNEQAIPLPTTSCLLLTEPIFTLPFRVDGNGERTIAFLLPLGYQVTARVQFVEVTEALLGVLVLRPSNGVLVRPDGS
ncbi:MAG: hypothetical protein IPM29_12865 [Planctomycetes bacterium]|nr:hypothetical protein [Planctomycetota bacterium]